MKTFSLPGKNVSKVGNEILQIIMIQQKLKSKGRKEWANTDCHCRKTFMMKVKVKVGPFFTMTTGVYQGVLPV